MNGLPMMHMTIPEEIQGHIENYIRSHEDLTPHEKTVLQNYADDGFLLRIMGFSFFEEWQDCRDFSVKDWTTELIEEILTDLGGAE